MSDNIERLAAELETIRAEIVELSAVEEPTTEQAERAEALLTTWDEKKAAYDKAVERAAKVEAIRQAAIDPANRESGFGGAPQVMVRKDPTENLDAVARGWVSPADVKSRALSVIETSRDADDNTKQGATLMVERNADIARHALLHSSAAYTSAFETILRHGTDMGPALLDDEQRHALRAALSNTDANGGYTVPFLLDPSVILTNNGIVGSIRSLSRVVTGVSDYWNGVTSAGVTAEWLTEGSQAADASPTVGNVSIKAEKASAYVFSSYEQSADGSLVSELPRLFADAKMRLDEAAFATGSGTNQPKGVVTALAAVTASRVSPTTGGTFSAASEVYLLSNAIPPRHASNSVWLANKAVFNKIRGFDTYGGSSFWADLGPATPSQLLGQAVYETSTMTATVTTGSNLLVLADLSDFVIFDRVGATMKYVPVVVGANQRPTGQEGWFLFWRTGADYANANAGRVLQL